MNNTVAHTQPQINLKFGGVFIYDSSSDRYFCKYQDFEFDVAPWCFRNETTFEKIDGLCENIVKNYGEIEARILRSIIESEETKDIFDNPSKYMSGDEFLFDGDFVRQIDELEQYKLYKNFIIRGDCSVIARFFYNGNVESEYTSINVDLSSDLGLDCIQFGS